MNERPRVTLTLTLEVAGWPPVTIRSTDPIALAETAYFLLRELQPRTP